MSPLIIRLALNGRKHNNLIWTPQFLIAAEPQAVQNGGSARVLSGPLHYSG
jgi:hypothetical protein